MRYLIIFALIFFPACNESEPERTPEDARCEYTPASIPFHCSSATEWFSGCGDAHAYCMVDDTVNWTECYENCEIVE